MSIETQVSMHSTLHDRALECSTRYRRAEGELIEILQQVEQHRVHLSRGHPSLFQYVVAELGLSENVAYSLITVSRKAREVPALKSEIQSGSITLTNARRVAAVLTPGNQEEWLTKAASLSQRGLEREIVKVAPEAARPERVRPVAEARVRLELEMSDEAMKALRRAQDLMSQSGKKAASLEETLLKLCEEYLKRHDPVVKAERAVAKAQAKAKESIKSDSTSPESLVAKRASEQGRVPIPAFELHQVSLRDQGRCSFVSEDGKRCTATRWLEVHHRIPVSKGGTNALENLQTLCSAHHAWTHRRAS